MRILMTGATGLIGRELGKALAARGDTLVCLVRDIGAARRRLPDGAPAGSGWAGSTSTTSSACSCTRSMPRRMTGNLREREASPGCRCRCRLRV